ncbi:MAG TPA: ABC transporter permease [Thermoleophilaceae bacterium]|jgi:ABC-2 type transport system permease protein
MTPAAPILAVIAKEAQLHRRDPAVLVLLFVAPLLLIVFLSKALAGSSRVAPYDASVPGFTAMFALFGAGLTAMGFHRERMWGTWQRSLSLPVRRRDVVLGKAVPVVGIVAVQGTVLLFGGALAFGIPVERPLVVALATVLVGGAAVGLGVLVAAVTSTDQQIQQLTNVLVLLLGLIGGAMAPLSTMPGWVQAIAPASPDYWAVDLFSGAMAAGAPPSRLLADAAVLALFTAVLVTLGAPRIHRPRASSD